MKEKVIIVGGVAGGASTATRLRRMNEEAEILLIEKGPYISFANCGLPYYIGGVIEERESLLLQTPEAMKNRFDIDVRVNQEVLQIHQESKEVEIYCHVQKKNYREKYDRLVLSPGSTPLKPPIPGIESEGIFSLWNIPDVDRIHDFIKTHEPEKAVVIGGGFIGLEMAENLRDLGLGVAVVEMADQVMAPLDYEMAQLVHLHMLEKGVQLHLKDGVKRFDRDNDHLKIVLQSGEEIEADMVILSIGIRPQTDFIKNTGLELNQRGGIVVDGQMKTSDPSIYAIGDAIEVKEYVTGEQTMIPLAGPANKQGRICANVLSGKEDDYRGSQGTSVAKVFDLTVATTGLNEKALKSKGQIYGEDYHTLLIHPLSHAGYYPGAHAMTMKVIFDSKGKILGAQNIGVEGVEKRIDVIATAMHYRGTVYDLTRLELAYAPPYSSAKDPVNMAGYVGENILEEVMLPIHWHEIESLDADTIILDVREPMERETGFIPGSVNIPINSIRKRISELDPSKKIVVYCAVGIRGHNAARILKAHGFQQVYNLVGGYYTYVTATYDVKKGKNKLASQEVSESGDVV